MTIARHGGENHPRQKEQSMQAFKGEKEFEAFEELKEGKWAGDSVSHVAIRR